jgi:hypothetical protein
MEKNYKNKKLETDATEAKKVEHSDLQEFFFPNPVPMTIRARSREEAEKQYQEELNKLNNG